RLVTVAGVAYTTGRFCISQPISAIIHPCLDLWIGLHQCIRQPFQDELDALFFWHQLERNPCDSKQCSLLAHAILERSPANPLQHAFATTPVKILDGLIQLRILRSFDGWLEIVWGKIP